MAGVWVFKKGVAKLVANPGVESIDGAQVEQWLIQRNDSKALVWLPTMQVIRSYADLEEKLALLGWRRYSASSSSSEYLKNGQNVARLQFHRGHSSPLLISLPADFHNFRSMHMFDIVFKNRHHFEIIFLLANLWMLCALQQRRAHPRTLSMRQIALHVLKPLLKVLQ